MTMGSANVLREKFIQSMYEATGLLVPSMFAHWPPCSYLDRKYRPFVIREFRRLIKTTGKENFLRIRNIGINLEFDGFRLQLRRHQEILEFDPRDIV